MSNKTIKYLKDYAPTDYLVDNTDLTFMVNEDKSVEVQSITAYAKNPATKSRQLTLDGEARLISLALNQHKLNDSQYVLADNKLILCDLPDKFTLHITTLLFPEENKSCMGLYVSGNNLITQCEPQGFRKITYYQDRSDVLATFTTTIITKNSAYNTLLSNGNKVLEEINNNQQKTVKWHDPYRKPSYLFALVIGNFAVLQDNFITQSGRQVNLEIYTDKDVISRAEHAMQSLKRAMRWDEQRFNLEYDLDNYMIVATRDFNMGAMENKGLNVFNTKYILADKDTATDIDFINIEAVIGHEYFHNWTGNRVTCRDWFQLSLKEGLTVFRDHQFTADLHNRGLKRIQEVKLLRQVQFAEDAGPLAHSVRPSSYLEIDNFYTTTVYEKGSEVVRMYQTILGYEGFNQGLALYLSRHDGHAATCEDFCQAMMDANKIDLQQFMLWYSQAGTPKVKVSTTYDADKQEYQLSFTQSIPDTPGQTDKQAMLIPIKIGLIDKNGHDLKNLVLDSGRHIEYSDGMVLLLTDQINTYTFKNITAQPIPSLLRGFSAPIKLEYSYTDAERLHLIVHDNDEFNRFEHLQALIQAKIIHLYHMILKKDTTTNSDNAFWAACNRLLNHNQLAPELRAIAFTLPTFLELAPLITEVNPQALTIAINNFAQAIGENLFDSWMELYNLNFNVDPHYDFNHFGQRSLKNTALFYILKALSVKLNTSVSQQLIETMVLGQYHNTHNMTDSFAVLAAVSDIDVDVRQQVLNEFYAKWQDNELVMDKWFAVQAVSRLINVGQMNKLMTDKAFIATNPNKIYALLRSFTQNGLKFHNEDGYSFIVDNILTIDKFNPHVASTLTQGFSSVVHLAHPYRKLAKSALQRVIGQVNLSNAVYEIAGKILTGLNVG